MKRTKFNLAVLLVAVVYFIILVIGNVTVSSVGVAAVEGSHAYKFAKNKNLPLIELADSEKGYLDQRYELFEYNETRAVSSFSSDLSYIEDALSIFLAL